MSTIGAMAGKISRQVFRSSWANLDQTKQDAIWLAIITAIQSETQRQFRFNGVEFTFPTIASTEEYGVETSSGAGDGYPTTLIRIDTLALQDDTLIFTLEHRPIPWVVARKGDTVTESQPDSWAWNADKIVLSPVPDKVYTVIGRGLQDIGTPTYSYNTSTDAWAFLDPDGVAMTDSYTSKWFTDGEDLIRYKAAIELHQTWTRDSEAGAALVPLYSAAKNRLLKESDDLTGEVVFTSWGGV